MEECQNCKWSTRGDYYKYKGKILCWDCLLDELVEDRKITREFTTSYYEVDMRKKYITIIKEKGEFDFEVSALVGELSYEEYKELKSMLITAIGTMETIRREKIKD